MSHSRQVADSGHSPGEDCRSTRLLPAYAGMDPRRLCLARFFPLLPAYTRSQACIEEASTWRWSSTSPSYSRKVSAVRTSTRVGCHYRATIDLTGLQPLVSLQSSEE